MKSYGFASHVDNKLDPGFYFLNDLILKSQIRDAVNSELQGLGYQKATSGKPDMLVNFRVFEQPTTLRGFEGMGEDYWSGTQTRTSDDRTEYKVKGGTLMVNFVDVDSGEVIWQGFASGLIDNGKFVKDEGKVREAVNLIFDEFGQRANEYSRR